MDKEQIIKIANYLKETAEILKEFESGEPVIVRGRLEGVAEGLLIIAGEEITTDK